ncbi:PD-(D/E)XK nuclease family protein [Vulcanisaeta sp. JCM 14467]|uniref:PD-(D/E)XK nuclease family protein n=1 Tax=Vulcanisaeta sp. JCM 14467 TaxID=1295370 RepID=UPI0006D00E9F|nr:PD-(D/E)XK nuclease family protein [Vulcanisaeta sp. JCM 14467]
MVSNSMVRFGRSYVTVSEIAQQLFCEYKLHLSVIEGRIQTPAMEMGIIIHDEVFRGRRVNEEEFINAIRSNEVVIATLPLVASIGGVNIIGIPDAVVFMGGVARAVIELKTSNKWLDRLFDSEHVQAQLYAYLISRLGLGVNPLVMVIKVKRDVGITDKLRRNMFSTAIKYLTSIAELPARVRFRDFVIYISEFDKSIEVHLKWALDYWLMHREPKAMPSIGKCAVCEFNDRCPFRAYNPNPNAINP